MITLHLVILRLDRGIHFLMEKRFYVYILASRLHGTLYVGVTSDLLKRVWEHKKKLAEGFTERYGVDKLDIMNGFEMQNLLSGERKG